MKKILKVFKGDSLKAQLLKGATGSAGLKLVNTLLTFVVGVLLARNLGPENYGIYTFVLSIITLLSLPTKAGLPTLIVRETAKYQQHGKWSKLKGLLTLANVFVVGFSIFVALIAAGTAWMMWGGEQSIKTNTFLWALMLLPIVSFDNIRGATLRGLRKVVQGQVSEQLVKPLVLVILVGGATILERELTPQNIMQYTVIAALIAFTVGIVLLLRCIPRPIRCSAPSFELNTWARSLIPLSLIAGIQVVNSQIGIMILGYFGFDDDAGLYKVASSVVAFTAVGQMIANVVLAPYIVKLFHFKDHAKLQRLLALSARVSFCVSLPVVLMLIVWSESLLSVMFGNEYREAYPALVVLCVGQVINVALGSVGLSLNQLGLEKKSLKASYIAVISNFSICLVFIPQYGLMGAAYANAISVSLRNIINWHQLCVHRKIDSSIWGRNIILDEKKNELRR